MKGAESPQVFLSYASPDRERVLPFYEALNRAGVNAWIDFKRLVAGQNWDLEITRAIDKCDLIVSFVSANSVVRRSYIQHEMRMALRKASEKLPDDICVIPVVLDESVELPDQIKHLHAVRAGDPDCLQQVIDAVTMQLGRLGVELQRTQRQEDIYWGLTSRREDWDGLPGYEVEIQLVTLSSSKYPYIGDVSDIIRAELLAELMSMREVKFEQQPDWYNYGQDKYFRTNTYDAHCQRPSIRGKALSVVFSVHTYGAGAAHPNMHFMTFSFVLDPLIHIRKLEHIFNDPDAALVVLKTNVRSKLKRLEYEGPDGSEPLLDTEQVDAGTESWSDFAHFCFRENGIDVLFAPYHVGAYACGPQTAEVPYSDLLGYLKPNYRSALGLASWRYG